MTSTTPKRTVYGAIDREERGLGYETGAHNDNDDGAILDTGYDDYLMTNPLIRTFSESMQTLANAQFHLSHDAIDPAGDRLHTSPTAGTATIPSEVANMTKNLIGGGVLSLSGGMALFANDPTKACPAAVYWVVVLGAVFGYFCIL